LHPVLTSIRQGLFKDAYLCTHQRLHKKMKRLLSFLLFLLVLIGCSTYRSASTWKVPGRFTKQYNKLLVVGIVHDSDLTLRQKMEAQFVSDLQDLGYMAVSALAEFGPNGLLNLAQEDTYLMLCGKGIDGVVTLALIDKRKEEQFIPAQVVYRSSMYYYDRIWNYRKIRADVQNAALPSANAEAYRWESIFFDLTTLEPVFTIQTKSFEPLAAEEQAHRYGKNILSSMVKNKVLKKQPQQVKTDTVRAF
jgi:hypothetical protein